MLGVNFIQTCELGSTCRLFQLLAFATKEVVGLLGIVRSLKNSNNSDYCPLFRVCFWRGASDGTTSFVIASFIATSVSTKQLMFNTYFNWWLFSQVSWNFTYFHFQSTHWYLIGAPQRKTLNLLVRLDLFLFWYPRYLVTSASALQRGPVLLTLDSRAGRSGTFHASHEHVVRVEKLCWLILLILWTLFTSYIFE